MKEIELVVDRKYKNKSNTNPNTQLITQKQSMTVNMGVHAPLPKSTLRNI